MTKEFLLFRKYIFMLLFYYYYYYLIGIFLEMLNMLILKNYYQGFLDKSFNN
jgi:hypothetical protein